MKIILASLFVIISLLEASAKDYPGKSAFCNDSWLGERYSTEFTPDKLSDNYKTLRFKEEITKEITHLCKSEEIKYAHEIKSRAHSQCWKTCSNLKEKDKEAIINMSTPYRNCFHRCSEVRNLSSAVLRGLEHNVSNNETQMSKDLDTCSEKLNLCISKLPSTNQSERHLIKTFETFSNEIEKRYNPKAIQQ